MALSLLHISPKIVSVKSYCMRQALLISMTKKSADVRSIYALRPIYRGRDTLQLKKLSMLK